MAIYVPTMRCVRRSSPRSCLGDTERNFTLPIGGAPSNYSQQLMRGLLQGPAAEPPAAIQAARRHAACRSLPPSSSFVAASPARRSAAAHLKPLTAE